VTISETQVVAELGKEYRYGFHDPEEYFFKSGRGLNPEIVAAISEHKNEPEWMRKFLNLLVIEQVNVKLLKK